MMRQELLLLLLGVTTALGVVLVPPNRNLALGRRIHSSSTCGESNGVSIREMYCTITASAYSPHNQYSFSLLTDNTTFRHARMEQSFLQGGQNCDFCEANTSYAHPASNMVDGSPSWWQSPPLSRGREFNEVNITIDLEQEFHVAYVWIQMANSPRPGTWVLERSVDYGITYQPWQYFASSPAECARRFGTHTLKDVDADDAVICTHEYSQIHPMENGEIVINLLENRPSKHNFSHSPVLQNFARATNVRLRLIKTKTLQGHLMDLNEHNDPTVTRRYYYAIKEILMGGRCVCNGHADSCDVLDVNRPRTWMCRCEHNTCGDNCEQCCPGFVQKKWQRAMEGENFQCEQCNCNGHSYECEYDPELDAANASLDIHGNYSGGGRCLNCQHNTQGINCNQCVDGHYRPAGYAWNDTYACHPCRCDPAKHNGKCAEETGKCECLPRFTGEDCDQCAPGYYDPPECTPCPCYVNGTEGDVCLPVDGKCPCKPGYGGEFCDECETGFTNISAGCTKCVCNEEGSVNSECDKVTGQCVCKSNHGGIQCDECAKGYFDYPKCEFCNCDPSGTEGDICDPFVGQCLCKPGFAGQRCGECDEDHYDYPNCKQCNCDEHGSKNSTCDIVTGECPCFGNFTGRTCDKCAAGYYKYPECLPCDCYSQGSKGLTCDNNGQCYCKSNFIGKNCNSCQPNFFNFPICEECNCNPSGVTRDFAGCDKVAPGELCTCKKNVDGRTCNDCKETFWDLQNYHPDGCVDCACNMTGTLSLLNSCDKQTGQCVCKQYAGGTKCDQCADGFYHLNVNNHVGCESCDCDAGGAVSRSCNMHNGQCRCRPRVEGLRCDSPITDHYFPTLWHQQYEAENGHRPDGDAVRFASSDEEFPDFSFKGFAVFSPIQDDIRIYADIRKSSMYKLLLHYVNPTPVAVDVEISVHPIDTNTADAQQNLTAVLAVTKEPLTVAVNEASSPIVLNPGRWEITFRTPKRLFLDYIVLLPLEYYEAPILSAHIYNPCPTQRNKNELCLELLYPPLPFSHRVPSDTSEAIKSIKDDEEVQLEDMSTSELPESTGNALVVETDEHLGTIKIPLEVSTADDYVVVLEYYNTQKFNAPLKAEVLSNGNETLVNGNIVLNHCPYDTFCRELLTTDGLPSVIPLSEDTPATLYLTVQPNHRFGIAAVNLIPLKKWRPDFLRQTPVCIRHEKGCKGLTHQPPPSAIISEAESGPNVNNSVLGEKLSFNIEGGKNIHLVSLDSVQSTVEISGVVSASGHYIFVVHYFNPDNSPITTDVLVQSDHFADAQFNYCPSVTGCRTLVVDKNGQKPFFTDDKYTLTFYYNSSQIGPIYIDSVAAVPYTYYRDSIVKPLPVFTSPEFFDHCSENHFQNHPDNVSDFCRDKIFSLTTEFNGGALPCGCNPHGSTDFCCDKYGGQCKCKANIIGRSCDRCAPGHYDFPNCIKCKCGVNKQCNEQTGQCFCPQYVEGQTCDKCVSYGYGYDPLIGCQLCGCRPEGSYNGELRCDPTNGQCLCKDNVGGRRCDRCLPGFYGYPHCHPCDCDPDGTTEAICDERTAQCICKKNVGGPRCDTCVASTFFLRGSNPVGCASCFCFGTTDRCTSSNLPVHAVALEESSWTTDDPSGNVSSNHGVVKYTGDSSSPAEAIYFVRKFKGNDYTTSYGLSISFIISSVSDSGESVNGADVKLISNNSVVEYFSHEQPFNASERFHVKANILAENWLLPSGEPASRQELMLILRRLNAIAVRASPNTKAIEATLEQFEIEVAGQREQYSPVLAKSVERCACPTPYTGLSCQECAAGYYRVKSDSVIGSSCVPCNCHGHTGTCDPDTGVCLGCQHNTEGEHCESCIEGYHGNASNPSPYACQACECPLAIPTNNFAVSCQVDEVGILSSCQCKPGFAGRQCESCDSGFFGNPVILGGNCEPCFCNENNNLTEAGSCHPVTGDCALCQGNTDGRRCEVCKDWYYGDALLSKNCTECSCNQCGSHRCDNANGECTCKPLVEGENCDHCAENAWGFDSCRGCRSCECGEASSNAQCDLKTGQCPCMSGADGLQCERCKHGYWDYGANGCKKCDCEADLSLGTVCDIRTGQCHCQEGATGPRCDQCIDDFLRIPIYGCRHCDECVFALNAEVESLQISADALSTNLNNMSSVALAGSRLNKINKRVKTYKPTIELIGNGLEDTEVKDVFAEAEAVLSNVSQFDADIDRINDAYPVVEDTIERLQGKLSQVQRSLREFKGIGSWVIGSIKTLVDTFAVRPPIHHKQQLLNHAEELLEGVKNISLDEKIDQLKDQIRNISILREEISEYSKQKQEQANEYEKAIKKINDHEELINAFIGELTNSSKQTTKIQESVSKLPFFELNAIYASISEADKNVQQTIADHREANNKLKEAIDVLTETNKVIQDELGQLLVTRQEVQVLSEPEQRRRRSVSANTTELVQQLNEKAQQAKNLSDIFQQNTAGSEEFLSLNRHYDELLDAIKAASNYSHSAIENALEAQNEIPNIQSEIAQLQNDDLETNGTTAIDNEFSELNNTYNGYSQRIAGIKEKVKHLTDSTNENIEAAKSFEIPDIDKTVKRLEDFEATQEELDPKIKNLTEKVQQVVKSNNEVNQAFENSNTQLNDSLTNLEALKSKIKTIRKKFSSNEKRLSDFTSRIAALKEKIALVRDKTNQIKLSARFQPDSYLKLPLVDEDVSLHTDLRFFFRTPRSTGTLAYIGNEERQGKAEYIALELEEGKPKLTIDFGEGPASKVLPTLVNDNNWREVIINRAGRHATIKISAPNSDEIADESHFVADKDDSVLELIEKPSVFIGGFPDNFRTPVTIADKTFIGEIDTFRANGKLIGLWNSNVTRNVHGSPSHPSVPYENSEESPISFDGDGYLQIGVQSSSLRKKTSILLSFMTYSPNGLLFFVGKDHDQLVVELTGGQVSLSFDLGSGVGKLRSKQDNYNDGKWHIVQINRIDKKATMQVDESDIAEGESPGAMFEMSVSDSIYLGGLPQDVEARFTVTPFRGCLKNLKIDTAYPNLHEANATKGTQPSCPYTLVRKASLISERAKLTLGGLPAKDDFDLALRFRTNQTQAHIVSVLSSENNNVLRIDYDDGKFVVASNGQNELLTIPYPDGADSAWHYLSASYKGDKLIINIDDDVQQEANVDLEDFSSRNLKLDFGRINEEGHFVGCIADVIWNGVITNFAEYTANEIKLTQCAMALPPAEPTILTDGVTGIHTTPDSVASEEPATTVTEVVTTTTTLAPATSKPPAAVVNSCGLPLTPLGEREDSTGLLFGSYREARLEFNRVSELLEPSFVFSIQLRAVAKNGFIAFLTSDNQVDFLTVYLKEGFVNFAFGQTNHYVHLVSSKNVLDYEWHTIRIAREGSAASLFVDDVAEGNNRSIGLEDVEFSAPLYVGGLPKSMTSRILQAKNELDLPIRREFAGCMRGFTVNDKKMDDPSEQYGIKSCAVSSEEGIYFGKDGGYAVLDAEFDFSKNYVVEFEIRPRNSDVNLLAVGLLQYANLQIVNHSAVLNVEIGEGNYRVEYAAPTSNSLCDGRWHEIKLIKKKNIISLNVDQQSSFKFIKVKSGIVVKNPLYLGALPKNVKYATSATNEPYIGCVRNIALTSPEGVRKEIDVSTLPVFGDVKKGSCPNN